MDLRNSWGGGMLVRSMAILAAGALVAGTASGHHSDAAIDINSIVNIEGVVTEYSWRNPHVYFTVEIEEEFFIGTQSILV